mmetsp:Transcript_38912/g.101829  ORF Transcript_38912/g.101829 Transcript_38912/m.101829 type:complete len:311 (-) Transcript_38912:495-1427(-)
MMKRRKLRKVTRPRPSAAQASAVSELTAKGLITVNSTTEPPVQATSATLLIATPSKIASLRPEKSSGSSVRAPQVLMTWRDRRFCSCPLQTSCKTLRVLSSAAIFSFWRLDTRPTARSTSSCEHAGDSTSNTSRLQQALSSSGNPPTRELSFNSRRDEQSKMDFKRATSPGTRQSTPRISGHTEANSRNILTASSPPSMPSDEMSVCTIRKDGNWGACHAPVQSRWISKSVTDTFRFSAAMKPNRSLDCELSTVIPIPARTRCSPRISGVPGNVHATFTCNENTADCLCHRAAQRSVTSRAFGQARCTCA